MKRRLPILYITCSIVGVRKLNTLCNRGKSCKSSAELTCLLCRDAADLSRDRLRSNPRQVKLLIGVYFRSCIQSTPSPSFKCATLLFVAVVRHNKLVCSALTLIATLRREACCKPMAYLTEGEYSEAMFKQYYVSCHSSLRQAINSAQI